MKRTVATHRKTAYEVILAPLAETEGLADEFHELIRNIVIVSLAVDHIGIVAVLAVGAYDRDPEIIGITLNARLAAPSRVVAVHTVKKPEHGDIFLIASLGDNDIYRGIVIEAF